MYHFNYMLKLTIILILICCNIINCSQYSAKYTESQYSKSFNAYKNHAGGCQTTFILTISDSLNQGFTLDANNFNYTPTLMASNTSLWLGAITYLIPLGTHNLGVNVINSLTFETTKVSDFLNYTCEDEPYPLDIISSSNQCDGMGCIFNFNTSKYITGSLTSEDDFTCSWDIISVSRYRIKCNQLNSNPLDSILNITYISVVGKKTQLLLPSAIKNSTEIPDFNISFYPQSLNLSSNTRSFYQVQLNKPIVSDLQLFYISQQIIFGLMEGQGYPNNLTYYIAANIAKSPIKITRNVVYYNNRIPVISNATTYNIFQTENLAFVLENTTFTHIDNSCMATFTGDTLYYRNQQKLYYYRNSIVLSLLGSRSYQFPDVIVSGNYKSNKMAFDMITPPYDVQYQIQSAPLISTGFTDIDSENPTIVEFTYVTLRYNIILMRVKALDDKSGMFAIKFDQFGVVPYITSKDLVEGSLTNGTYEVLLNIPSNRLSDQTIYIYDQTGRYTRYTELLGKIYFGFFKSPVLPFFASNVNTVNIVPTKLRFFIYNDIDLSFVGCKNIMYFNLTNVNRDTPVLMTIGTLQKRDYLGLWDKNEEMYAVEFYLPPRSSGKLLDFRIGSNQFIYYSGDLYSMFGPSSELRYHSQVIDCVPPMITSVTRYPSENVTIENDMEIGWDFTIKDDYNGFKSGLISVITDLDGYEYNFTVSPSSNQSIYEFNYSIRIPIISDCVSQIFTIRYVTLFDNGDYQSESSNPSNPPASFFDPFMKILGEPLSITVTCPIPVTDITSPEITNYTLISPNTINTASYERSFSIEFQVTDSESPISTRHIPKCFATEVNFGLFSASASKINSTTDGKSIFYRCQMNLPYGFGFPSPVISISIHGYADNKLNFGGVSASDLKNQSREYFINVSFDRNGPSIDSTTDIDTNGGQLTIFGHNFGILENNSVQVKLVYPDSSVKYNNILFLSYVVVVIDGVLPNQSYFNLTVITDNIPSNSIQVKVINGPPPPIKPKCEGNPICGGVANGLCTSNGCQCIYPWYGLDCLSQTVISQPTVNQTKPDFDNTIPIDANGTLISLKSLVSIIALNEISPSGKVVSENYFTKWNFTKVGTPLIENTTEFIYSATIKDTCIVNVTILIFANQQTYIFANERLIMPPSSLKYTIEIFYYPFKSPVNTLQLVMSASLQTSESSESTCSYQQFSPSNGKENGDFMKLQIDTHSLYGRFIKRAIIDNRVQTVTNTMIKSNTKSTNTQAIQLIGINIPSFIQNAVIDPDFSILIDSKPANSRTNSICQKILEDSGETKKGLTKVQLVGVIIGPVGFAIVAIISVSYFIYKKKYNKLFEKDLSHKMNSLK